jgi:predicted transcriptional regulator
MRINFTVELPDALAAHLANAADRCDITPQVWIAETVEAVLAAERLPNVIPAHCGARLIADHEYKISL